VRVPLEWLAEYCAPELDAAALATRLAMTGTEVDRIHHHGVSNLDAFVVGRVLATERHPDADRLTVCRVEIAEGVQTQIVCGSPNVAAGQTVAIARPGAIMPDGTKLKRAKLRGVVSDGMILAEDELAISTEHDDTIELAQDGLVVGQPLDGVLPIATEVLELEITPNRPDCLGVYGVAREVHAATGAALAPAPWEDDPHWAEPPGIPGIAVVVEATDLCPRFTARAFEEVTIGPSPMWLKARLMAVGQRPINNVVDITNYVMLLTGQPLHAFDLDRIAGAKLVVRRAARGEEVVTLDGQTRVLDPDVCLIADDDGPTSIAGVMGATRSEVQPDTTRVLMEVASWDGPNIHATSQKLGLRSEASARFEKGLSPEQTLEAQAVASQLMLDLTGATALPGTIDEDAAATWPGDPEPEPPPIHLRDARVRGLLGVEIDRAESAQHLRRLGFEAAERDDGLDVTVPHWRRNDVTREADLIEEVARLHGVNDQLPSTLPSRRGAAGILTPAQRSRRRAEDALSGRGLHEIVGWSFQSPDVDDRLRLPAGDPRRAHVVIENPMSADQSVLRTTLLGSLLGAAAHNAAHGQGVPGIFESGAVYRATGDRLPHEHHALGALVPGDLFAAKAYLEALLRTLRVDATFLGAQQPFLHPGRSAEVRMGETVVGWVGDVHPLVYLEWDVEPVAAFEIDLDLALGGVDTTPRYEDLTSFPELREDIAIVVDATVPAATVLDTVRAAGGKLLAHAEVFDVYRGEQIAAGRTSLAIALTFRAKDRTLTDADVAPIREKVVARLAKDLGGELRG
jgi:phenylalanyl-tRNA synthetase beta chain